MKDSFTKIEQQCSLDNKNAVESSRKFNNFHYLSRDSSADESFLFNQSLAKSNFAEFRKNVFLKISFEASYQSPTLGGKMLQFLDDFLPVKDLPWDFDLFSVRDQRNWMYHTMREAFPNLSDNLLNLTVAKFFHGDCGNPHEKPEWYDEEKFKRGQKFVQDNFFAINLAQMTSLAVLFAFDDGVKPLIATENSTTPYTAFKRYLSTGLRLRNWFTQDPWTKGTSAYKDICTVRKMHKLIRKKIDRMSDEKFDKASVSTNLWCPATEDLLKDFKESCPEVAPSQCPLSGIRTKNMNQCEMSLTQLAFFGLILLYPEEFGIHNAKKEDLEGFCHVWRVIGYLLGIEDEFNFIRGTLDEIKERAREVINMWVIPHFRQITPAWEHMLRCASEGLTYYLPGVSFESCVYFLMNLLGIEMPRMKSSMSYYNWISYKMLKVFFGYTVRVPGVKSTINWGLNYAFNSARTYCPFHLAKLKKKSKKTLLTALKQMANSN